MAKKIELEVYRTLALFSYKSSNSFSAAETQARSLYEIIERYAAICQDENRQLFYALLNLIALTINGTLFNDKQLKYPQITDYALEIIYDIIKLLHYYNMNLWNGIDSTLFNQKSTRIFIFPGQPKKQGWKFVYGSFVFPKNITPRQCNPLDNVQHVVHNIDNVLTILLSYSGKAHFKGSVNPDFSGPPLCWFAPLPPSSQNNGFEPVSDSLDPNGSRYGCFRFTIPFKTIIQRFPRCFILGSRKYNQEHSHTILLTTQSVEYITLFDKLLPTKLTDTTFIQRSQQPFQNLNMEEVFEWLCFHDNPQVEFDQLEFAVATEDLKFDPIQDNIRLDFVDHHSKICVPSLKKFTQCECRCDKNTAMKHFLAKLTENNIQLETLKSFFTDTTWHELHTIS